MKIIATVKDSYTKVYLAEVTDDEISTIQRGDRTASASDSRLGVGSIIRVGDHWRRVAEINDAQKRLDNAAQSLRAVADLMATIDVVVPPATTELEGGAK